MPHPQNLPDFSLWGLVKRKLEAVELKTNDVLTPIDSRFGAAGNGDADDIAALQACVDVVPRGTASGVAGAAIWLGPHTYRTTDTLFMNRQAIRLLGDGIGTASDYGSNPGLTSMIKWDGAAGKPMIQVNDSAWNEFSNFILKGHDTNTPSEGIFFEWSTGESQGTNAHQRVDRVHFGHWPWGVPANSGQMDYGIRFGGDNGNNDQFEILSSKFRECTMAGIAIDNSQSVWGLISKDHFQECGIGIRTSASVNLFQPTFVRSTTDIEINGSPEISVYKPDSEHAVLAFDLKGNGGKLFVKGGKVLCQAEMVGDYWMRHENLGGAGAVALDGLCIEDLSGTKKLYARGNASSSKGLLSVRDCPGIDDLANHFDVQAGTGTGGLEVSIDSYGTRLRERLTASAAMSTAIPEITGSAGGNAALANLLAELAGMGLITDSST